MSQLLLSSKSCSDESTLSIPKSDSDPDSFSLEHFVQLTCVKLDKNHLNCKISYSANRDIWCLRRNTSKCTHTPSRLQKEYRICKWSMEIVDFNLVRKARRLLEIIGTSVECGHPLAKFARRKRRVFWISDPPKCSQIRKIQSHSRRVGVRMMRNRTHPPTPTPSR